MVVVGITGLDIFLVSISSVVLVVNLAAPSLTGINDKNTSNITTTPIPRNIKFVRFILYTIHLLLLIGSMPHISLEKVVANLLAIPFHVVFPLSERIYIRPFFGIYSSV